MLGAILEGMTNTAMAGDIVAAVARPDMLERVRQAAATDGVPVGVLVASRLRHVVEHGAEEIWLDLLGAMSGSSQPGAAAIERLLARAFPDPIPVRITRKA
jgi:hypothetical protein